MYAFDDPIQAERQRLKALHQLNLLDSEREPEFDQLVELAAAICGTPISSCSLIDEHRQWFKASVGLDVAETPRDLSLCAHAIKGTDLMIVEDTTKDSRFQNHPSVLGDRGIRFYAGMPLPDPNGMMLGTLCVADTVPRALTETQKAALRVLTEQVKVRIELALEKQRLRLALHEKEELLQALRSSDDRFRSFVNNGPLLSYIRDEDGRFVFYSKQVAKHFGVGMKDWLGKTLAQVFPIEDANVYLENDRRASASETVTEVLEESKDMEGVSTTWRSFKFRFLNEHGRMMIGGVSIDVTEELKIRQDLEEKSSLLERSAHTDVLTGLANRRAVETQLSLAVKNAVEHGHPLSLILLDVDNFKLRNDTFGHQAGDEVLRKLGMLLLQAIRQTDLAGRFGGEEMIVLLPGAAHEQAVVLAERIRARMKLSAWANGPVTASFGVASLTQEDPTPEAMIGQADRAMYEAKRAGKDRVLSAPQAAGQRI